jgi:cobalt-zinc-cadmium resistance protein CzcA
MARKEVQDWVLDRRFKSVPGVIDVTGYGGPSKIFKLEMDPNRLNALHVTQQQVVDAVGRSNGSTGGSYIVQGDEDYMIRGMGLLASVADIRNVVVATTADGTAVHVADVADVSIGEAVRKGQVGMANSKGDRDDVVEGIVLMRRGENPSNVVENIKASWQTLQSSLPAGMHLALLLTAQLLCLRTSFAVAPSLMQSNVKIGGRFCFLSIMQPSK